MDCFEILEIDFTTDKKEIKKAYARLLKKYHPEENPSEFEKINKAYIQACNISENNFIENSYDDIINMEDNDNFIENSYDDIIKEEKDSIFNEIEEFELNIFDEYNFYSASDIFDENITDITFLFESLILYPKKISLIEGSKYYIHDTQDFLSRWNFFFKSELLNNDSYKERIRMIIREYFTIADRTIQKDVWDLLLLENEKIYLFDKDSIKVEVLSYDFMENESRELIFNEIERMKIRQKSIKTIEGWIHKFKELYQKKSLIEEYDELFNEIEQDRIIEKKESISQILKDLIMFDIDNMTYDLIYKIRRVFAWNHSKKNEFYYLEKQLRK